MEQIDYTALMDQCEYEQGSELLLRELRVEHFEKYGTVPTIANLRKEVML